MENIINRAASVLHNGQAQECLSLLEPLVKSIESQEADAVMLVKALDLMAQAYCRQKLNAEAVACWQQAWNKSKTLSDNAFSLEISLLSNYAFGLLEMRNFKEALKISQTAVDKAKELSAKNPALPAFPLLILSSVFYEQKDFTHAMDCIIEAKELWEKSGNLEKAATCMNNLGRINEELDNLEEGILWHQKAVTARRSLANKEDLAFSLGNLGVALAKANKLLEAVSTLTEALELYSSLGMSESREYHGYKYNLELCKQALGMED